MRVIEAEEITKNVREMCIEANVHLSEDMERQSEIRLIQKIVHSASRYLGSCVRILM